MISHVPNSLSAISAVPNLPQAKPKSEEEVFEICTDDMMELMPDDHVLESHKTSGKIFKLFRNHPGTHAFNLHRELMNNLHAGEKKLSDGVCKPERLVVAKIGNRDTHESRLGTLDQHESKKVRPSSAGQLSARARVGQSLSTGELNWEAGIWSRAKLIESDKQANGKRCRSSKQMGMPVPKQQRQEDSSTQPHVGVQGAREESETIVSIAAATSSKPLKKQESALGSVLESTSIFGGAADAPPQALDSSSIFGSSSNGAYTQWQNKGMFR
jgi:hypothetical protein